MSHHRLRWIIPAVALVVAMAVYFFWRGAPRETAGTKNSHAVAEASPTPPSHDLVERRDARKADLDDALSDPRPGSRSAKFGRRLAEWFREDPEGVLAYLQKMPRQSEYTAGLLIVLGGIAKSDPERALGLAQTMAARREDWILYNAIFDDLARTDPSRATMRLDLVPAGEPRQNATRALAEEWMMHDSSAAWTWAQSLGDKADRGTAIEAALAILSRTKPEETAALAQQLLTGDAQARVLAASLRRLAADDPQTASRMVSALAPGPTQTAAALDVARALADQHPEAALAWLRTLPPGDIQTLGLNNVLDVWSVKDPNSARRYVSTLPAGPAQDAAASHLALTLAAKDPTLVFDWAAALPSESARNAALVGIASSWARAEPAAATAWADSFPMNSPIRTKAINSALSYWALQDAAGAGAFVPKLSDTEQPQAIMTVAPAYAQKDASAALQWAQSLSNEDIRAIAVDAVVTRWAGDQPQQAAEWIMSQPESSQRVDYIRTVTDRMFAGDSSSAIKWVQSLPPGPTRDGAVDAAAAHLTEKHPLQAAALAATISSPALREARIEQLRTSSR